MFDFPMFETAIGLCLVFSLFGLLVTAVQELIASLLDSRGKFFNEGIQNLLYLGVPEGSPKPDDSANPKNAYSDEVVHPFRAKLSSCSGPSRPPVPGQAVRV